MSRRLNVDRMRRYVARTTPDVRQWRFTLHDLEASRVDPQSLVASRVDPQSLVAEWGRRMRVKHPGSTAHLRQWDDYPTGEVVVEARVRP